MTILALHGFLGCTQDWQDCLGPMSGRVVVPDLAVWATREESTSLESTARALNSFLLASLESGSESGSESVIIVGYSLGARLAAHCILDQPDLYRGAVLISMNPGLIEKDRAQRLAADRKWAERFRTENWQSIWAAWSNQDVLKAGTRAKAKQSKQDERSRTGEGRRQAWARALEVWSLGTQSDLREPLADWAQRRRELTVMTGTEDEKFTQLTAAWHRDSPHFRHRTVLGAGHRVLGEAPEDVCSEVSALVHGR